MKFKHNFAGHRALRVSPPMLAELERWGRKLAEAAGPGNEASSAYVGRQRGRVTVRTATYEAMRNEARNHNLIRALSEVQE